MNDLPKNINPCPIIEADIEIRFTSMLPDDAVFGVIYSKISSDFPHVRKLPILQIPEAIRSKDPSLIYNAHYSLTNDKEPLQFNIGPRAIIFVNIDEYIGWDKYFSFINDVLDKIDLKNIILKTQRIGLRYINFFDLLLFNKINLDIKINNKEIRDESTHLRTEIKDEGYIKIIKITNNLPVKIKGKEIVGSLIDIDCIYNIGDSNSINIIEYKKIIDNGHNKEKTTFFNLLKPDFLKSLNPEY
ncbi:MAG: TIGR04255 family protein [Spirochaetales bacterium]|nr:TIGR04255 family protein [Spirochaetales bacterium]